MKKFVCLLLALVLSVSALTACAKPNPDSQTTSAAPATLPTTSPTQPQLTTAPTQPTTIPTQPEDLGVEVEARVGRGAWSYSTVAEDVKWPIVITSLAELRKFADSEYGKSFINISEMVDPYSNDAFFEEYSLVLIGLLMNGSWQCMLRVDSCIKKDGYYLINLACGGHIGGDFDHYVILCVEVRDKISYYTSIYYELLDDHLTEIIR